MNLSLLCKWWWKLETGEGLWQEIVRKKYKIKGGIARLKHKPDNSPVWNDLLKVKELYLAGRQFIAGNGSEIDFWRDPWCGAVTLQDKFGCLFEICNEQSGSVADMAGKRWSFTFRRWLDESAQNQLRQMRNILTSCALGQQKDKSIWIWEAKRKFSVKSMYAHLCSADAEKPNKNLWKAKIPLKIKIFMWLIQLNAILTKDNLAKRKWQGDKRCSFCNEEESTVHLFFECYLARYIWSLITWVIGGNRRPSNLSQYWDWSNMFLPANKKIHMVGLSAICWALWKTRNRVCFEGKRVRSPTEIICLASSLISYWAGLQKDDTKEVLEAGAEMLKNAALAFHTQMMHQAEPGAGAVLLQ
jgi:hypothetical protein